MSSHPTANDGCLGPHIQYDRCFLCSDLPPPPTWALFFLFLLSANRVDLGFLFHKLSNLTPPPLPQELQEIR